MNLHAMIDEIPLDRPVAILIRHAEREAIEQVEDSVIHGSTSVDSISGILL